MSKVSANAFLQPGRGVLYAGFLISFLASLPPGVTNMITIRLAVAGDHLSASLFAAGVLLAELVCAKVCMVLISHALRFKFVLRMLHVVVLAVLVVMAIVSFTSEHTSPGDRLIENNFAAFASGFLLMAINPVQIPFWLGWTTILLEKDILSANQADDRLYLVGIGLGSLVASVLFVAAGSALSSVVMNERIINFLFGCVFTTMALIQAGKVFAAGRWFRRR